MGIKEVAKLAGVSPSTVSRVVNGKDPTAASPETQRKIWDAVREMRYVPNQDARSLKNAKADKKEWKRDIDCVYARMAGDHLDPFFTNLMYAAEQETFSAGYHLRYYYSALDIQRGNFSTNTAEVDSVIVLGRATADTLALLRRLYKNIVCAGLNENSADIDQVICSGYKAARDCVRYLASLGHTAICYMGETENEQRYQGYIDAMKELELPVKDAQVADTPFTPSGGYDAVNELMKRGAEFSAIFCANDMSAIGALKALREHRFKVPQDVSLIGINDMETVRYLDPMLTSVHIPLDEMGRIVAKILIDRIEGGHRLPMKIEIPTKLVYRESCGPARRSPPTGKNR